MIGDLFCQHTRSTRNWDIGINNAGIAILGGDEELEQPSWDKVIAVNLTGVWLCAQAEAQLALWLTASENLARGQTVDIAGRRITYAETLKQIDFWDQRAKALSIGSRITAHRLVVND